MMGSAIVLKDVISGTAFTFVLLVIITAWTVDQAPPLSTREASGKWAGPVSAAIIIAVAAAMKVVLEW
jgi:hypothetical protein